MVVFRDVKAVALGLRGLSTNKERVNHTPWGCGKGDDKTGETKKFSVHSGKCLIVFLVMSL